MSSRLAASLSFIMLPAVQRRKQVLRRLWAGFCKRSPTTQSRSLPPSEGAATGIGTTLVFGCDLVIAAASERFASPLEAYDLVPDGAIGLLIPRRLAHHRAFSMLVPGRSMRAERAFDAGLIDVIVAPGQAAIEAERIAQELCRLPPEEIPAIHTLPRPSVQDVLRRMAAEHDHRRIVSEAAAERGR
ncbi:enoyl-CoA hydratase-related protein [Bradyrhizobium uaiense]